MISGPRGLPQRSGEPLPRPGAEGQRPAVAVGGVADQDVTGAGHLYTGVLAAVAVARLSPSGDFYAGIRPAVAVAGLTPLHDARVFHSLSISRTNSRESARGSAAPSIRSTACVASSARSDAVLLTSRRV